MFNGVADPDSKLVELSNSIGNSFQSFLDENSITDPVAVRAIAHFVTSGIDCAVGERILRREMRMRKSKGKEEDF